MSNNAKVVKFIQDDIQTNSLNLKPERAEALNDYKRILIELKAEDAAEQYEIEFTLRTIEACCDLGRLIHS